MQEKNKRCYFHTICRYANSRLWLRKLPPKRKRERIINALNFHEGLKKYPNDFDLANNYKIS